MVSNYAIKKSSLTLRSKPAIVSKFTNTTGWQLLMSQANTMQIIVAVQCNKSLSLLPQCYIMLELYRFITERERESIFIDVM